jgi:hypothetical protein
MRRAITVMIVARITTRDVQNVMKAVLPPNNRKQKIFIIFQAVYHGISI